MPHPAPPPVPDGVPGPGRSDRSALEELCRRAVALLGADGAVVQVVSADGLGQPAAAWGHPLRASDLEFELGEGPGHDAFTTGRPVLVPDVWETAQRWPGLAGTADRLDVRSIYAFPIAVGAARLGVLAVYGRRPHQLSAAGLRAGSALAAEGVDLLLDQFDPPSGRHPDGIDGVDGVDGTAGGRRSDPGSRPREEVYQAQGMVMVDLGVSLPEALARLRGHAYAQDRTLAEVAHDIVAGRLRLTHGRPGFETGPAPDGTPVD